MKLSVVLIRRFQEVKVIGVYSNPFQVATLRQKLNQKYPDYQILVRPVMLDEVPEELENKE